MNLNRRTFSLSLAGSLTPVALTGAPEFTPNWDSIGQHKLPEWFADAKLGIFVHWGLYSVPAWAPPTGELGKVDWSKWFYQNPYAEWYLNSLRLKESATFRHHVETYGEAFDYYRFSKDFNEGIRKWDPKSWAERFRDAGARYVVLTTKHHDGYPLWPTKVKNPHRPAAALPVARDIAGELTSAVRSTGMRMGFYYSGGLDWTFDSRPIASLADLKTTAPQSEEYARYADSHWRELIDRYKPSVLWNDISYPKLGKLAEIFADYYNRIPDGLVNNRFSQTFADFTTPEYAKYDKITEKKWESCRGLGFSFGYNRAEGAQHALAPDKLIELFVDIVSKNGNLLLNVGPRHDGTISDLQTTRLDALAAWLKTNGEGIFGSRPWKTFGAKTPEGSDVRYTIRDGSLYAYVVAGNGQDRITLPQVKPSREASIKILGGEPIKWQSTEGGAAVELPRGLSQPALRITPAPAV